MYSHIPQLQTLSCDNSENKAGYTATLFACGWAGAVLEKVTGASGQEPYTQKAKKRQKSKKGTDRPTDLPTDQPTQRGVESRSTRLRNTHEIENFIHSWTISITLGFVTYYNRIAIKEQNIINDF